MDMWEPFRLSLEEWLPQCRIVYDKFHIMQHANEAIDEVRRAEFFRKGGRMRGVVKGKRWLLLSRWANLTAGKRQELNHGPRWRNNSKRFSRRSGQDLYSVGNSTPQD